MWAGFRGDQAVAVITYTDPAGQWPDDLIFRVCPDDTKVGAKWDGSAWLPPAPLPPVVPAEVPNASARRVMQRYFVPTGQSFYTVVGGYLHSQITATAALPDNDPAKVAALGAWTQWDMGNYFSRTDPLVASMAQVITAAGGTVDLDALFVAIGAL